MHICCGCSFFICHQGSFVSFPKQWPSCLLYPSPDVGNNVLQRTLWSKNPGCSSSLALSLTAPHPRTDLLTVPNSILVTLTAGQQQHLLRENLKMLSSHGAQQLEKAEESDLAAALDIKLAQHSGKEGDVNCIIFGRVMKICPSTSRVPLIRQTVSPRFSSSVSQQYLT